MALTVNTNIINDTDGYLLDAKNIKGTYIVADDIDIRDALPSATTVEGTLCYVKSEDKTYRMTADGWVEEISGAVQDIIINGGSIVKDGVATIPLASYNAGNHAGLVRFDLKYGIVDAGTFTGNSQNNGILMVMQATINNIKNREAVYNVINPQNLDNAVKYAMCDGKGAAWTADEQAGAKTRIGITEHKVVRL